MPNPSTLESAPGNIRLTLAAFIGRRSAAIAASWIDKFHAQSTVDEGQAILSDLRAYLLAPAAGLREGHAWPLGQRDDNPEESVRKFNAMCRLVLVHGLDAFGREHPDTTPEELSAAREYILDFFEAAATGHAEKTSRDRRERSRASDCALEGVTGVDRDRLAAVFESSPSFIAVVRGPSHVFELANAAFRLLAGPRDILGQPARDALPELAGQGFLERLDEVYATGAGFNDHDTRLTFPAGGDRLLGERFFDLVFQPTRTTDGTVTGVLIHGIDCTGRRLAQQALAKVTEQMRLALDSAQMGWWHYDPATGSSIYDERFKTIFGFGDDDCSHEEALARIHPDDRARIEADFAAALHPRHPAPYANECRITRRDGSLRWLAAKGSVSFEGEGENRRAVSFVGTVIDVTEARAAEDALRKSESEFRQLADAMPQIVWRGQADGYVDFYNRQWNDLTGFPPGTVGNDMWADIVHPDDLARVNTVWSAAIASGQPYELEVRIKRTVDGAYRWFLARALPFRDAAGEVARWFGTATDITGRKVTEEALAATAERLYLALETTRSGPWDWNLETGEVFWSEEHNEMFDLPREQRLGSYEQWIRTVHPDDHALIAAQVHAAIEERRDFHAEIRSVHGDGSLRWVVSSGRAQYDAAGKAVRVIGMARDITAHKQAQEDLRESEERFRLANVHSPFPVMLHAEGGEVLLVNDAWTRLSGYPREEIRTVGDWIERVYATREEQERTRTIIAGFMQHEEGVESPARRIRCANGEERIWDFSSAALGRLADGRRLRISTATDATERYQHEQALRLAKEEAERANAAKSLFLSRMSHELRTPLNAILGFGQILRLGSFDEQDSQCVDFILKGGKHLLSLVNEVLDLARVESGELALKIAVFPLEEVLQECVGFIAKLAQMRQVTCTVEARLPYPHMIRADEQRLRQVLFNLLSNAIKYNRQGGRVTVSYGAVTGGRVCLRIRDTGPGIPAEDLARLFVPFERLGQEYGETEGSGLGLVVSRRLVEAMDGTLDVESKPGYGSTFWVELAAAEASLARVADTSPSTPAATRAKRARAVKMLYVEDNSSNLQVMQTLVARLRPHWQFLAAKDGPDGLAQARQFLPELILLDLQLPGMQGDAVLIELRKDPATRGLPVLMLSADATAHSRERLLELGASDYLPKPFVVDELLAKLDTILAETRKKPKAKSAPARTKVSRGKRTG